MKKKKKKLRLIKEERIAWEYMKRKYGRKAFKNGLPKKRYLEKEINRLKKENRERSLLFRGLVFLKHSKSKSV